MPRVRVMTSVASAEYAYGAGDEVDMPAERAQEFLRAGWGVLVRSKAPETPEGRAETPETTVEERAVPAGRAQSETTDAAHRRQVRRKTR